MWTFTNIAFEQKYILLIPHDSKVLGMKVSDKEMKHYVTPNRISSVVKHFLKEANLTQESKYERAGMQSWVCKTDF